MTREQEIKEIAIAFAIDEVKDTCNPASKRGLLYAGFVSGAEWADQHPHWISVDDELPNNYEPVIAAFDRHFARVCFHCGDTWYLDNPPVAEPMSGITHWMPLPEKPKGGEEMERLTVEWQDPCNNHREKIRVLLYEKGMTSKEIVERLCDVYKNEHVDLETLLYWAIQTGYNKCDCNPKKGGEK